MNLFPGVQTTNIGGYRVNIRIVEDMPEPIEFNVDDLVIPPDRTVFLSRRGPHVECTWVHHPGCVICRSGFATTLHDVWIRSGEDIDLIRETFDALSTNHTVSRTAVYVHMWDHCMWDYRMLHSQTPPSLFRRALQVISKLFRIGVLTRAGGT